MDWGSFEQGPSFSVFGTFHDDEPSSAGVTVAPPASWPEAWLRAQSSLKCELKLSEALLSSLVPERAGERELTHSVTFLTLDLESRVVSLPADSSNVSCAALLGPVDDEILLVDGQDMPVGLASEARAGLLVAVEPRARYGARAELRLLEQWAVHAMSSGQPFGGVAWNALWILHCESSVAACTDELVVWGDCGLTVLRPGPHRAVGVVRHTGLPGIGEWSRALLCRLRLATLPVATGRLVSTNDWAILESIPLLAARSDEWKGGPSSWSHRSFSEWMLVSLALELASLPPHLLFVVPADRGETTLLVGAEALESALSPYGVEADGRAAGANILYCNQIMMESSCHDEVRDRWLRLDPEAVCLGVLEQVSHAHDAFAEVLAPDALKLGPRGLVPLAVAPGAGVRLLNQIALIQQVLRYPGSTHCEILAESQPALAEVAQIARTQARGQLMDAWRLLSRHSHRMADSGAHIYEPRWTWCERARLLAGEEPRTDRASLRRRIEAEKEGVQLVAQVVLQSNE